MTRRAIPFLCEGNDCVGTLDEAPGATGLLIVSGGNEIRAGTWNSQARLAAEIAAAGHPVFRFDRRGVGDSPGTNAGFRGSAADITAALDAFRAAAPGVSRIVALGNCDAASALMLMGGAGCDGLILSNPWTIEEDDGPAPPPEALRAHYAQRLTDPAALLRVLRGRVSPRSVLISVRDMLRPKAPSSLAGELRDGVARFSGPVRFLLAGRDRTAQVFRARWDRRDARLHTMAEGSHSFVEPEAQAWLLGHVLEALGEVRP